MNIIKTFESFSTAKKPTGVIQTVFNSIKTWFSDDTSFLKEAASLLFDGSKLHWVTNGKIKKSWTGTSGLTPFNSIKWKSAALWGNKYQKDKAEGPIPEGQYVIGAIQKNDTDSRTFTDTIKAIASNNKTFKSSPYSKVSWGNYRTAISPVKGTNTYGRSHFYIHGGTLPGSHGCIDLTSDMDDFSKLYTSYCALHKKTGLPLKVVYAD